MASAVVHEIGGRLELGVLQVVSEEEEDEVEVGAVGGGIVAGEGKVVEVVGPVGSAAGLGVGGGASELALAGLRWRGRLWLWLWWLFMAGVWRFEL